jgi:hypothetical protein
VENLMKRKTLVQVKAERKQHVHDQFMECQARRERAVADIYDEFGMSVSPIQSRLAMAVEIIRLRQALEQLSHAATSVIPTGRNPKFVMTMSYGEYWRASWGLETYEDAKKIRDLAQKGQEQAVS